MDIGEAIPEEVLPPYVPKWQMECLNFFRKVSTQWTVGGMGGLIGLNYLAVIETAKIYGFELEPYKMEIIRFLEKIYIERSNNV